MEDNDLRRCILEILYEKNKEDPGIEIGTLEFMNLLKIEPDNLDNLNFNARYLKEEGYIKLTWYAGAFNAEITHKGINLIEDKFKTNTLFGTNKLKTFISYSTLDEKIALHIKEWLELLDITCIMAPSNIDASKEWMKEIVREIEESDIFIPLLSSNYKKSNWCSQEAGMAYYVKYHVIEDSNDFQIIPLWLDDVEPFGFLARIQGKEYSELNLLKAIIKRHGNYMRNKLIESLGKIEGPSESTEYILGALQPSFEDFSDENINEFVNIAINNDQIHNTSKSKEEYLPNFINTNKDRIEKDKLDALQMILNQY